MRLIVKAIDNLYIWLQALSAKNFPQIGTEYTIAINIAYFVNQINLNLLLVANMCHD